MGRRGRMRRSSGLYREHSVAERGFAFLKDPLFLASSVFVERPQRIMALAFVMTLCLLVYQLAEVRVRQCLAATGQTVPDQVGKPTLRPTLHRLFGVFRGHRPAPYPAPGRDLLDGGLAPHHSAPPRFTPAWTRLRKRLFDLAGNGSMRDAT
jgi:hypothetical protein